MHTLDLVDPEDRRMTRDHASATIAELPPSAKLIVKVMVYNDMLT